GLPPRRPSARSCRERPSGRDGGMKRFETRRRPRHDYSVDGAVQWAVLSMISVQSVSMRFGSKVLFEDVTTTFSTGRRYGLTGPNGSGKSTFMKLLTGEQPPQRGTVV